MAWQMCAKTGIFACPINTPSHYSTTNKQMNKQTTNKQTINKQISRFKKCFIASYERGKKPDCDFEMAKK